jgi:hypothetical protein
MPGDEFDQYKVPAGQDEFAQYRQASVPGTISGSVASIGPDSSPLQPKPPSTKWQGSFIERAESQMGQDLQNPANLIPSLHSLAGIPGSIYDAYQSFKNRYQPKGDPAELAGHIGTQALLGAVMSGGAEVPGPAMTPERVPFWKNVQTEGTEVPKIFNRQPYANPAREPLPSAKDIPQAEWDAGHDIAPNVENTPIVKAIKARASGDTSVPLKLPNQSVKEPYSGPRTPTMEPAQSGTIAQHGYHADSSTMVVQFKNGNVYELRGVPPEVYDAYKNSESQGSFYQQNLKGRYTTNFRGKVGK